jgi:isopentenyl-diphosphate delta-isomerase
MAAMNGRDYLAGDPARDDMLILVDVFDREIGTESKWRTHVEGLLHRAFSVVLVRDGAAGLEFLLAKRSATKYHSAGLWANSCCSHPRAGEQLLDAAYRRVGEELGCKAVELREIGSFAYRAVFENGLCEYEYDHVFVGRCEGEFALDAAEVSDVRWIGLDALAAELAEEPQKFAVWTPTVFTMTLSECC